MLHAATCGPKCSFGQFMADLYSDTGLRTEGVFDTLRPDDVLPIIRARQGVAEDDTWLLLLGMDDFNKLFSRPVASIDDPAAFLWLSVRSLLPLLHGDRPTGPHGLSHTTVVAYLAGNMPGVVADYGPVFKPGGMVPESVPLAPLSRADCEVICESQPALRGRWRTLREFRHLMDALQGWPRPLSHLLEATCKQLTQEGPDGVDWGRVSGEVHFAKGDFDPVAADLSLICSAMLGTLVDLEDPMPGMPEAMTWEKVVEQGSAMLVPTISPYLVCGTHQAVIASMCIEQRVRRPSLHVVPVELHGLRRMYDDYAAIRSAPGASFLRDADLEELVAFFEGVRPELVAGLQGSTPRQDRRVSLADYYEFGRFGRAPVEGFSVYSSGQARVFSLKMIPPAEVQRDRLETMHLFPQELPSAWDNGHVFRNAPGASCGEY
jgi:hypothetical protein